MKKTEELVKIDIFQMMNEYEKIKKEQQMQFAPTF